MVCAVTRDVLSDRNRSYKLTCVPYDGCTNATRTGAAVHSGALDAEQLTAAGAQLHHTGAGEARKLSGPAAMKGPTCTTPKPAIACAIPKVHTRPFASCWASRLLRHGDSGDALPSQAVPGTPSMHVPNIQYNLNKPLTRTNNCSSLAQCYDSYDAPLLPFAPFACRNAVGTSATRKRREHDSRLKLPGAHSRQHECFG